MLGSDRSQNPPVALLRLGLQYSFTRVNVVRSSLVSAPAETHATATENSPSPGRLLDVAMEGLLTAIDPCPRYRKTMRPEAELSEQEIGSLLESLKCDISGVSIRHLAHPCQPEARTHLCNPHNLTFMHHLGPRLGLPARKLELHELARALALDPRGKTVAEIRAEIQQRIRRGDESQLPLPLPLPHQKEPRCA